MIARKTWREIRGLVGLYVLLLEIELTMAILLWPWLRDQSHALAKMVIDIEFMKRWFEGVTAKDESAAYSAYMALQMFFKGINVMGLGFAIVFGIVLIARERESHTLEFLLARPVSRGRVLFSKFWVTAAALVVPIFLTSWSTIPLSWIVEENLPFYEVTLAAAYSSLFCFAFLAATAVCSVRFRTQLNVAAVMGAFVVFQVCIYFVQKIRIASVFRLSDYDVYAPILAGNISATQLFWSRGVWLVLAAGLAYLWAHLLFRKTEL